MELLALTFGELWGQWLGPILLLVFGFGLVIFVHELGHFLTAKWVGIKVERFAIGFGPRLFGLRRGETDYCVKLLPLGGYVKMLGQEDFNPHDGEDAGDPRSFNNKPIWARLTVVSAGVVMNVIFAAILFVAVCLVGIQFIAPVVGNVAPDFPAATAKIAWDGPPAVQSATEDAEPAAVDESVGLQPGDEILSINGSPIRRFNHLMVEAVLAHEGESFDIRIQRQAPDGSVRTGAARIGVRRNNQQRFQFGIAPPSDTVLEEIEKHTGQSPFQAGDRLISIDGQAVSHHWDIAGIIASLDGRPVTATVDRKDPQTSLSAPTDVSVPLVPTMAGDVAFGSDGSYLGRLSTSKENDGELVVESPDGSTRNAELSELRAELLDVLGMLPRLKVDMVQVGSPADSAGVLPGDVILSYADHPTPTLGQLHQINAELVGEETQIAVLRKGEAMAPFAITPGKIGDAVLIGIRPIIDAENPVLASVRPGSLAEKVGLEPGDVIEKINGQSVSSWNDIVAARVAAETSSLSLQYRRGATTGTAVFEDLSGDPIAPGDYAFRISMGNMGFRQLKSPTLRIRNPLKAIAWGARETGDFIVMTYGTLRGLAMRTLSPKELRGPVGIVEIGIAVGRKSVTRLVYFLAMISVSLAVINFLPLPIVDGGLAVLLLIEKARGRPLSLKVMNAIQMAGLGVIGLVFIAVTWQDVWRLISERWW
jgi:regulator of sigma E protease